MRVIGLWNRGTRVWRRIMGPALLVAVSMSAPVMAQDGTAQAPPAAERLVQVIAPVVHVAPGSSATAVLHLTLEAGWHVNANPPALDYNIPTTVTLGTADGLTIGRPSYPAGISRKFEFEDTPLLVYDGSADIRVPITAATGASPGERTLAGNVEFQACNDQVCLAPTKVAFRLNVVVDAAGGAVVEPALRRGSELYTMVVGDTVKQMLGDSVVSVSLLSGTAGATGSAGGSMAARGRLEQALAKGGLGWFLALFAGGLLLNLTPCVFPMLGVTVSIFGARRQQPLPRVITTAVLYVLGICFTYTALGVAAALTGGLFGSALQSVWVNVVLGGIMLALSLGMFGLYEMQPPAWLMDKLGGAQATNFAGAFLSGLGVGVIAAPCVGPFVVAVLALIAQQGDVGFGVRTMFTLSLGLGFPYLFLATFSNLLQSLPRSGGWMIWVKHGFGSLMAALGLYYLCIGFVPDLAPWVTPVGLALGGLWLGFIDPSAGPKGVFRMFTRGAGALALFVGIVMGVEMYLAAARTMTFKPYDSAAVAASVAAGRPVMLDFSADWCAPCHELELKTLSDERVVAEARRFDRYKVDLTKYDAPESEASRKRYRIGGVPTIVFLGADGNEVVNARVVGFMDPGPFLGQMRLAVGR